MATRDSLGRYTSDNVPWNKGKTSWIKGITLSDEHKRKIGLAHKGKKLSDGTKRKISESRKGKPSTFKGKKHSDATKKKMSDAKRGDKHPNYGKRGAECSNYGTRRTDETKKKMSKSSMGELNPMWLGGKSFESYGLGFNEKLREQIRERDNRRCGLCGGHEGDRRLHVHHVDYNKRNNDSKNLVSLCVSCHSKTNINRYIWKTRFNKNGGLDSGCE